MKLVLLPGMDGTGELFDNFLRHFKAEFITECIVIKLPQQGAQDHASLAKIITKKLPEEDFVLLAESFSGGLVPELLNSKKHNIKGVIFVASFLSCPNKFLLPIARILPLKTLTSIPLSGIALKFLFLGKQAPDELIKKFIHAIKSVPNKTLKERLNVMYQQQIPDKTYDIPTFYIKAANDYLVPKKKKDELNRIFKNTVNKEINGPHFILQAHPKKTAMLISEIVKNFY